MVGFDFDLAEIELFLYKEILSIAGAAGGSRSSHYPVPAPAP